MNRFVKMMREPSTWAGLGMFATLFGVPVAHIDAVTGVGVAICGALAVFLPEGK